MRYFLIFIGLSFLSFVSLVFFFFISRDAGPIAFLSSKMQKKVQSFDPSDNSWEEIPPEKYSYGLSSVATNEGEPIDWADENRPASRFIDYLQKTHGGVSLVIVPGFVPPTKKPIRLHKFNKIRLNMAVKELNKSFNSVVLLTGGNVKPKGTPFNEAMEMKKQLIEVHGVPFYRIAIEPNARNTVTNFRNAGRFMLAHGIPNALAVTTFIQNFYISFPYFTFFKTRSKEILGYIVGDFQMETLGSSGFKPNDGVWKRGENPKDP